MRVVLVLRVSVVRVAVGATVRVVALRVPVEAVLRVTSVLRVSVPRVAVGLTVRVVVLRVSEVRPASRERVVSALRLVAVVRLPKVRLMLSPRRSTVLPPRACTLVVLWISRALVMPVLR